MKTLVFEDTAGNRACYRLAAPDSLRRWDFTAFLGYLDLAPAAAAAAGYLARPPNPLQHQRFCDLVRRPESTLNRPVEFVQDGRVIGPGQHLRLDAEQTRIRLRRRRDVPPPALSQLHLRARHRRWFNTYTTEFTKILDDAFRFDQYPLTCRDGARVSSFAQLGLDGARRLDADNQLCLLARLAGRLHAAPFENYSRFLSRIPYRNGAEMWENLHRGFGGVCSEKTAALKFACDVLGLANRPVLGFAEPDVGDYAKRLTDHLHNPEQILPWARHHLLEIDCGSIPYLVDVTNGNLPLMILNRTDAEPFFRRGYRGRMVFRQEQLHLQRVPEYVGDALLILSEYHLPEVHFDYVFGQGLGLAIHPDLFVAVYCDWGGEQRALMQQHFALCARRRQLPPPRFLTPEEPAPTDDCLEPVFITMLETVRERLREQYPCPFYTGDFSFVLQPLGADFWHFPLVSAGVREATRVRSTGASEAV